jgi:hypothetical protein
MAKQEEEHWPQTVGLNIYERVLLWSVVPKEGDIVTLKALQAVKERIANTDAENVEYKFESVDGRTTFDVMSAKASAPTEFSFSRKEWKLVEDKLRQLEKDKKLSFEHLSLYEKFCEAESK